jgi:hypothetical protein
MVGRWAVLCLPALVGMGCAQARLLQRDANGGGIVAIPKNSNSWPYHYHRQAEELMAKQCPGGYVIEREQEVVTGQVTTTNTNTERHGVPVLSAVGLGPTYEDQATTTSATNVTEWRIWFRPKGAPPSTDLPPSDLAPAGGVVPASAVNTRAIAPK